LRLQFLTEIKQTYFSFFLINNIGISTETYCSGCGIKGHKCASFKPCIYPLCRDPAKEKDQKEYQKTHSLLICPTVKKSCNTCKKRGHYPDDHTKFDQVFV